MQTGKHSCQTVQISKLVTAFAGCLHNKVRIFFYKLIYRKKSRFRVGDGNKSSENDQLTGHGRKSFELL